MIWLSHSHESPTHPSTHPRGSDHPRPPPRGWVGSRFALQDGGFVIEATHPLADELRTPDRVRAHVVGLILTQVLAVVECSGEHRSFESWCHRELPLALDAVQTDLKPIHGLGGLAEKLGGEEQAMGAIVKAAEGRVLESGQTSGAYTAIVEVAGETLEVRGAVVDDVVRVSTAFKVTD